MDRNPMAEDKRKGRKPTRIEYDQRIELTYQLLAKGQRPSVIARAVAQKFGCATKTVKDQYLSRARTIMLAEIARAKTELRAESLALYRAITAEPKASNRDKKKAQERIDKLLALEISQAEMYVAVHPEAAKTDDQSSITSEQRAAGLRAEILGELAKRGGSLETGRAPGKKGKGQAG